MWGNEFLANDDIEVFGLAGSGDVFIGESDFMKREASSFGKEGDLTFLYVHL